MLLAVGCLTACAQGAAPLAGDESLMALCTPVPGTAPVVSADEILRNETDDAVTVDAVRLVGAQGVTLRDAHIVPIEDRTLLGTTPMPPASSVWQERRQAVGATLAPGETWNLALTLDRSAQPSRFTDVEVDVTAGGDDSTVRLGYALTVTSGTCETSRG